MVFDTADPDKKKELCLLGVHISLIMPRTEFVLRDEHNDTQRLKQKEDTINHLEEELRSAREKHTQEREKRTQELETQYNVMRKRIDVDYRHVESLNIKLKEDNERLIERRDTYVREQVDRTIDVYKQQLNQEKKNTEIQQRLISGLQEELDSLKSRKNAATELIMNRSLRSLEPRELGAHLDASFATTELIMNHLLRLLDEPVNKARTLTRR